MSTPKSGADRVVPVIPELRAILEPAMKRKLPEALLVVDELGGAPRWQKVLRRSRRCAAPPPPGERSFHSIRHLFVTALLNRGVSAEVVRVLAGHSKLEVTQGYAHASGADLEGAMARVGAGFAPATSVDAAAVRLISYPSCLPQRLAPRTHR